jgi:diketogulonate reductase-like aldo/keto reductase
MTGLREAFDSGKAKAVGVCNYDATQMEVMHSLLSKHNIPLACNQVPLITYLRTVSLHYVFHSFPCTVEKDAYVLFARGNE